MAGECARPRIGSYAMLGRISARTGVRKHNTKRLDSSDITGAEVRQASGMSRLWRRPTPQETPSEVVVEDDEAESPSRFEPVRFSPVETTRSRNPFSRKGGHQAVAQQGAFSMPGEAAAPPRKEARRRLATPVTLFDKALLGLEVAGALVVAWLAFQYVYTVYIDTGTRRISGNSVAAARPTGATATPTRTVPPTSTRFAEVLPPVTGDGEGEGAAPTATRVRPGSQSPTATRTAAPTMTPTVEPTVDPQLLLPTRLRIPAMFLDSKVQEVTINMGQWEVSALDIGHHEGTGNPGETGNVVLAGHRDINSALFRELDRLGPGDEVYVSNSLGEYKYIVRESFEVSPDQIEVMAPTDDKRVTLITCTPIGLATRRLIVVADLEE